MKLKTTQELAKLSGVSSRTLRYYDEIGLLPPKIRMANGRSLYGFKEFIYLTKIITFKEFGFSLNKIKSILHDKPAYKLSKLIAQKKILSKELDRLKVSFKTIESLINFYKEKPMLEMSPEQMEMHLDQMKNKKEYTKYFDETFMKERENPFKEQFRLQVGDEYYEYFVQKSTQQSVLTAGDYGRKYGAFLNKMIEALEKGQHPASTEVQTLLAEQWEILKMVYPETRSQKIYFAIRNQSCDFPAVEKKTLALRDFLYQAMTIFGKQHFID